MMYEYFLFPLFLFVRLLFVESNGLKSHQHIFFSLEPLTQPCHGPLSSRNVLLGFVWDILRCGQRDKKQPSFCCHLNHVFHTSVCVLLKCFLPPVDIQHIQRPCRFIILERDETSVFANCEDRHIRCTIRRESTRE